MIAPIKSGGVWWLVVLPLPIVLWLAVFVVLDQIPGFEPFMEALRQGCDGVASVLPACADLDKPQRGPTPVPREFLSVSYIVILAGAALALALALLMASVASLDGVADRAPTRTDWALWLTATVILWFLLFHLPTPTSRTPSSIFVSLISCVAAGGAAVIVYLKLVDVRARLTSRRSLRRGL